MTAPGYNPELAWCKFTMECASAHPACWLTRTIFGAAVASIHKTASLEVVALTRATVAFFNAKFGGDTSDVSSRTLRSPNCVATSSLLLRSL